MNNKLSRFTSKILAFASSDSRNSISQTTYDRLQKEHNGRLVMSQPSRIVSFFKSNATAYMFLAPWLIGFFVLTLYPLAYSLGLSFTNYDFTKPDSTQFIGFGNYLKMFGSLFGVSDF